MISIGGIIGAGLFVGSSAAIAAAGPAIVLSYLITGTLVLLVMRMLGEMAVAMPAIRSFTEFSARGAGPWAGFVSGWLYWYFWVIVGAGGGDRRRQYPAPVVSGAAGRWCSARADGGDDRGQPDVGAVLWGVRILVLLHQGCGDHCVHRAGGGLCVRLDFAARSDLRESDQPRWLHAAGTGIGAGGGRDGAFLVDRGGDHHRGGGRIGRAHEGRGAADDSVIVRILTFYVGSILLIVACVPWDTCKVGESPFTRALRPCILAGPPWRCRRSMLTAVLSCLNSAFYVCSRVLFVLAGHGDAPQGPVQLNRRKVPVNSVLICALRGCWRIMAAAPRRSVCSLSW